MTIPDGNPARFSAPAPPIPRDGILRVVIPGGFDWHRWDPAIVCIECGCVMSATAPTIEMEQGLYDEMAAEHRRRCPGDGA